MLGFIEKCFFTGLVFFLLMVIEMTLCLFRLVSKQVNAVVVVAISIIHAQNCVPDVVKNLNVKVFNIVSGTNETRRIERNEMCKSECRFNSSVCDDKQRWNDDKYRCECKELIDKGVCDKRFIWNPRNCECGSYRSRDFSDYKNCKCKKRLVNKLTE